MIGVSRLAVRAVISAEAWPHRPAPARYRNLRLSRTSWPPHGQQAAGRSRDARTATACAGDCGFG